MRVCSLQPRHVTDLRLTQPAGVAPRSARMLAHSFKPQPNKTFPPFIAGLGADPILGAQRTKIIRAHRSHHKLHSLIHRSFYFPRHPGAYSLPSASLSVTYVWNHPCYPCPEPAPTKGQAPKNAVGKQVVRVCPGVGTGNDQ